jgi:hypothetical protein
LELAKQSTVTSTQKNGGNVVTENPTMAPLEIPKATTPKIEGQQKGLFFLN